ncbi:MAG: phosphate ABC transporter permease PstA [Lacunisphaera sp.]|nr:phosphate ABC transporter permease PstA [Lacunisphaera sp.]
MATPASKASSSSLTASGGIGRSLRRGEHLLWLSGSALALAFLLIAGLLVLVITSGAAHFWPHPLTMADRAGKPPVIGILTNEQEEKRDVEGNVLKTAQVQFKAGNRDLNGFDFVWVQAAELANFRTPPEIVALERQEYGDFYGFLDAVEHRGQVIAQGAEAWPALQREREGARALAAQARRLQKDDIGEVNMLMERERLRLRRAKLDGGAKINSAEAEAKLAAHHAEYERLRGESDRLAAQAAEYVAVMRSAEGQTKKVRLADIVRAFRPNQMTTTEKWGHYFSRAAEFVYGEPRESNTEGGVWPAIFGTVMMTIIMSIAVTPFGVIAAFYLREYARQGPVVRMVRIAINNLAGVPSIVFGVFGLGFFVYFIGGGIDRMFYPELLPTPTFGTGGILWASLTLALLTVPVVIVATEESIAAVPRGTREGSLALGASKFQTICNVVLPASVPGILTGVILAMARGAGEVAPLMITGVVKLAPELPIDGHWPLLHLDRKFMHLGFHIYDVGFQSPNIEAAKPMVYTTTLLLIVIIILLNLAAIRLRDRIRKKYQTGAF